MSPERPRPAAARRLEVARLLSILESPSTPPRKVEAEINVTPLVDIVLVLLIIFMVVTPLLQGRIELPRVLDAPAADASIESLRLSVDAFAELRVDGQPTSQDRLAQALSQAGAGRSARPVVLEADRTLPFGTVRLVLTTLRDVGTSQVGLATQAPELDAGREGEVGAAP